MVARREMSTAWNLLFTDYDLVISPTLNVLPFPVAVYDQAREET